MQNLESDLSMSIKSAASTFLPSEDIDNLSDLITTLEKIYISHALDIIPELKDEDSAKRLIKIAIPLESQLHFLDKVNDDDFLRGYSLIALIFEYAAKITTNYSDSWLFWLRSSLAYLVAGQSANSTVCAKKATSDLINSNQEIDNIIQLTLYFLSRDISKLKASSNDLLNSLKHDLNNDVQSLDIQSLIFGKIEFCNAMKKLVEFLINGVGKTDDINHHLGLSLSHFKNSSNENLVWLISRLSVAMRELLKNSLWNIRNALHEDIIKSFTQNESPIYDLWDNQLTALRNLIKKDSSKHHTLVMPTSAGKTLVAAITVAKELFANNNICFYVTPYKALVSEVSEFFTKYLEPLGIKTSYLPGKFDSIPYLDDMLGSDGRVFVLTPEKLDLLWRSGDKRLKECGIFIFDEAQNIGEEGRGLRLELLISRIKQNFGIYARILLLSAVLPEDSLGKFTEWLGSKMSSASKIDSKPTRSLTAIAYRVEEQNYIGDVYYWKRFIVHGVLESDPHYTHRNDVTELAIKYSKHLGPVLVYCNSVEATEKTLELIFQKIVFLYDEEVLKDEAKFVESILGHNSLLPKMLRYGIAFHHASLPSSVKHLVEKLGSEGKLRIICCTSTLVEGVNLNVGTVIISSPYSGGVLMNGLKIKNLAGRAGRSLKDTEGHVITMHTAVKDALTNDEFTKFQSRFFRYLSGLNNPTLDADVDALESDLLSRLYRNEIHDEKIDEDAEKIMKTTLFSRQASNLQYSAIMEGVKESAKRIITIPNLKDAPLKIFAETGLGIRNCYLLDEKANQLSNQLSEFRSNSVLNADTIKSVITASLLESSRFGEKLKRTIKNPIKMVELWVNGESLLNIASLIESPPSPNTIISVSQFLYGYVSDELSWANASLLKLIDYKSSRDPELALDYEWYLLPSYLKYGVNNPPALLMMLSGMEDRVFANRMGNNYNFDKIDWMKIICWILNLDDFRLNQVQNNLISALASFSIPLTNTSAKSGLCTLTENGEILQDNRIVGNVGAEYLPILKILKVRKYSMSIILSDDKTLLQVNPS